MRKASIILLVCTCLLLYSSVAFAGAAKLAREANRLYHEEKYPEAVEKYREAGRLKPDSDIIHFDMAAALYKKEDYKDAIGESQKALSTENEPLEAKATYNIGNSKYRLGLLEESLDYYKRSIELDTEDEDAKFNYEFVKKKLKEQQNQKKQQKPQSQEAQKEKEKEKEKEKPQQKKKEKPEEKKPEQDKTDQEEKDRKEQEEQKEPPRPGQEKEGPSEEETRMLLEAHRHEEESKGEARKKKIRRLPEVLKDW
ncbi:MAG: tetratricopeptide repeat protein [Candidatus Omnitrophota bacterium]